MIRYLIIVIWALIALLVTFDKDSERIIKHMTWLVFLLVTIMQIDFIMSD